MGPRPRAGRIAAGLIAVGLAGALAACSPGAATPPSLPPSSSVSPTAVGPASAVVDQFRDGYASGTIVLQLDDTASAPMTVVRAELVDARFVDGTAWSGSEELSPGLPISLPARTTAPLCDHADDGAPAVRVTLADGSLHTVAASDPHVVLPRIHADACFAERVSAVVTLRFSDALSPGSAPGTAVLTLNQGAAQPSAASRSTAGPAQATLVSVANTTLLDEDPSAPWPREVSLSAGGPPLRVTVRPARCDPHAVAEDKVGTLIPLTVRLGSATGTVKVAASSALRAEIYAFVARSCGWTPAP
ncbi:hypothetical protein [Sinomonas albida]|uniref:hypothetical protein n=1 Tax=Sinomonas albida TaxID=369942 RepID=UPI003016DE40